MTAASLIVFGLILVGLGAFVALSDSGGEDINPFPFIGCLGSIIGAMMVFAGILLKLFWH